MPEAKYTKDHEWIRLEAGREEAEQTGIVGITNFAQEIPKIKYTHFGD